MKNEENKNINEILLRNITMLIKLHGMTESECLGECGIHSNFITNLRNGKLQKPSFEDVYKLAKYFRQSIDNMILYTPEEGEPEHKYHSRKSARIFYNAYRGLSPNGKQVVNETIKREQAKDKAENRTNYKFV